MRLCSNISANQQIKVAVKNSGKGAAVAGGTAFIGGLLAGPPGLAVGKVSTQRFKSGASRSRIFCFYHHTVDLFLFVRLFAIFSASECMQESSICKVHRGSLTGNFLVSVVHTRWRCSAVVCQPVQGKAETNMADRSLVGCETGLIKLLYKPQSTVKLVGACGLCAGSLHFSKHCKLHHTYYLKNQLAESRQKLVEPYAN